MFVMVGRGGQQGQGIKQRSATTVPGSSGGKSSARAKNQPAGKGMKTRMTGRGHEEKEAS